MPNAYESQHVISAVLLRRWVSPGKTKLLVRDVETGREWRARPESVGFVNDFIKVDPAAAERRWQAVEERFLATMAQVDAGKQLEAIESIDALKDAVALHWARSFMMLRVHDDSVRRTFAQRRELLLSKNKTLEEAFLDRYGLHLAGPQGEELIADEILAGVRERIIDSGEFFAERVHTNFDEARARLANLKLQLATPAARPEFLIGDNPVLTLQRGHPGAGPLQGIPWAEADAVIFPLGPRHLLGIGSQELTLQLSDDWVEEFNARQVRAAFRFIYYREGGHIGRSDRRPDGSALTK